MRRVVLVILAVVLAVTMPAPAFAERAYVSMGARGTSGLWPFDTAGNRLVGAPLLRGAGTVEAMVAAPNRKALYLAVRPRPDSDAAKLEVLNARTNRASSFATPLPPGVIAMTTAASTRHIYIAGDPGRGGPTGVWVVDTLTHRLHRAVSLAGGTVPMDVIAAPDGRRVYLMTFRRVSVIDDRRARVVRNVALSGASEGPFPPPKMAITPNGRYLYASSFRTLDVISTATTRIVRHVPLSPGGPDKLAMAPNGRMLYVLYPEGPLSRASIVRVSTASNRVVGSPVPLPVSFPDNVESIAVAPNGRTLYVSSSEHHYVLGGSPGLASPPFTAIDNIYAIDTATDRIFKTIPVPGRRCGSGPCEPGQMAFAS